jgi:fumarate reductase flavoprotein subunit
MDPAILSKTAARMTRSTTEKYDDEFYKDAKSLRKVDKAPYYAISSQLMMFATSGGARVTENLEVVSTQGKVIPGLYAVGLDAGGLYGDSYDMQIAEGTASSFAINGARLAVKNMQTWMVK